MEEELLDMNNILSPEEIDNLFIDDDDNNQEEEKEDKNKKEETTEVNTDNLFEEPESVGSGKEEDDKKVQEDVSLNKGDSSPKNFYSSIAKALKDDDVFPDLTDEKINEINDGNALKEVFEERIQSMFDERQKRIDAALNADIEVEDIRRYENTISYLDSIKETDITDESENGEALRKKLIYQDFINRGYSKERAQREVQKSFNASSDIDDAKEALSSNKEFFKNEYENILKEAEEEKKEEENRRKEQLENLQKSILEDDKVLKDLQIDKSTRRKILDNISKPIYKDPKTGTLYTAIQKYETENRTEFLKNLSLIFTLTDGFKDFNGLIKSKVKKEVSKGMKELENTLNNTSRTSEGSLKYANNASDTESYIEGNWKLNI